MDPEGLMPSQFKFLVIEGCNGVGKSTITEYLCARLGASSFHYPAEFVSFRNKVQLDERVAPLPRVLYYLAATLHLSDLVRAQLTQTHVVCDRYLASPISLMIGESAIEDTEACSLVERFTPYLCMPDLILLLTAQHAVASGRINSRSRESGKLTPVARRILESEAFFLKRQDSSRRWASRLAPVVELDTSNLSPKQMCSSAWSLLEPTLNC
jgi:thymidylate kinase